MARDREQALTPPYIGRLWLLGALFLVTLPHLVRMPLPLSIGCGALLIWRLLHELRGYDLPGRYLRYLLIIIVLASVLFTYHSIAGQEAGVAFLTVMLSLKLLELRTMRDAMIALFIGYFMVIGGFLFSQSIFMGAYLFTVVLALTAALIALNHPSGNNKHNRYYLSSSAKLLLQAIPLMVVMFVLFPRLQNPLWSMPDSSSSARTGLSDNIEMGSISSLADSDDVAFRVDFAGDIPPASSLYWRGPVLWQTDGRRWERQHFASNGELPGFYPLSPAIDYTITLEPHRRQWIFALDLPVELPRLDTLKLFVGRDFQLLSNKEIHKKLRYTVSSSTQYRLNELSLEMEHAATLLPSEANPRTRQLGQQWIDQGLTPSSIVQRGYNLFRDQPFYYTRQPPLLDDDPVDQFLFETRRGFCEHYATAFVTLMRAADIPARVVTGYQGGELNELGDYLIVRQSDAHAWAEVWLDEQGWVRVDPTSAVPPNRIESSEDIARFRTTSLVDPSNMNYPQLRKIYWQLRHGWDSINHSWNQWVLGFDREKQRILLEKLGLDKLSWEWLGVLMIGTIAAILSIFAALSLLRRPYQPDPLVRIYHRFCSNLESAGISRRRDEGPADFAERVIQQRPDLEPEVRKIIRLYIRLRYTAHSASADLDTLRRLVRRFKPGATTC